MARPLRIEFSGALYHVTARGNAQQDIYLTDEDRQAFMTLLHRACERYHWLCHAYHYTLSEIGDEFGVSYATESRAVKEYELNAEV